MKWIPLSHGRKVEAGQREALFGIYSPTQLRLRKRSIDSRAGVHGTNRTRDPPYDGCEVFLVRSGIRIYNLMLKRADMHGRLTLIENCEGHYARPCPLHDRPIVVTINKQTGPRRWDAKVIDMILFYATTQPDWKP